MKMAISMVFVLLLATSQACQRTAPATRPAPSTKQATLSTPATAPAAEGHPLGERVSNVILHADQTTAFSIDFVGGDMAHDVFPHRQLGAAIVVNDALKSELSATLTDAGTYDLGTRIMCFEPGVRYEFKKGADVVAVEVCFNCQMLSVELNPNKDKEGRELVCFIPGYNRLLGVTKQILVHDAGIQATSERR